jgi:hypothetical protein
MIPWMDGERYNLLLKAPFMKIEGINRMKINR